MSARSKLAWTILIALTLTSLASNLYLVWVAADLQRQINAASGTAGRALDNAAEQLAVVGTQEFTLVVPIDQQIPIEATIDFDELFTVPIDVVVPINTTVNVPLQLGLMGTYNLDIPIRTEVPINLDVEIPIKKAVPINTIVPIKLDVPVTLSLKGTPLAEQLVAWRDIVLELRANLP